MTKDGKKLLPKSKWPADFDESKVCKQEVVSYEFSHWSQRLKMPTFGNDGWDGYGGPGKGAKAYAPHVKAPGGGVIGPMDETLLPEEYFENNKHF